MKMPVLVDKDTYRELLHERMAIMVYDAGIPEEEARSLAVDDMILNYELPGESEERKQRRKMLQAKKPDVYNN